MKKIIYTAMSFMPTLALAAIGTTNTLLTDIQGLIAKIIPIMFALAIVFFFWGLIEFLRSAGDPEAHTKGKSHMIYGIIAIAVMVSIYGLVGWLRGTLGVGTETTLPLPTVTF